MNDVIRHINTLLLPHGYCFAWDPALVWLHVVSDTLIALAYFSIPVALWVFVRRRKDVHFSWMFVMFGMFIMACGLTHLMGVWTIWQPDYWIDGAVKAYTAIVSLATAVLLWPLIPRALALPSPSDLERANAELQSEINLRRTAEKELRIANDALRDQVAELQAFSYAVAHDLRAPLRHIDGYAHVLQERSESSLSAADRRFVGRIAEAARHLGSLIDGLLLFTRTGSTSLNLQPVNTEHLVKDVLQKLLGDATDLPVSVEVGPLPVIQADATLLRLVFLNLIDNALKYSRDSKPQRIEIGIAEDDAAEATFFVRDNGAGFDMRYADKLFGVFQRLHHSDQFEGTGIGLANVRRIVLKHGGRVWAQAKVGSGATFYFTLKKHMSADDVVDSPVPLAVGGLAFAKSVT